MKEEADLESIEVRLGFHELSQRGPIEADSKLK